MNLQEHIYSILIVSAAESFNASLRELLPDSKFAPIQMENNIRSARRALLDRSYDLILINSPLPDETGTRFAIETCASQSTVTLLMVRAEMYTTVFNRVSEHGVYVLPKPTSKSTVSMALDWMTSTHHRMRKNVSIEDKMKEISTVNRAKWFLIDHLKMTEADAHRYIEKQAMDRCVSRKKIAEEIIQTHS